MALPEQIRKQAEAVQELYKQLDSDVKQGEDTPAEASADQQVDNAADNTVENEAPQPVTEQKPVDGKAPEDTVLQKYKTLQGMYNAEVPRLHQQNREMGQRLQQMEQLIASMSAQSASPAAPQQQEKFVTESDVADYGDSIDMMRRVSREELSSLSHRLGQIEGALKQMQTSVVPQVQAVVQRQAVSAEQQFWADLSHAVPNWREVNDNEAFQSWLLEADPLTGITRQTYLEDAQRAQDSQRVSNFFRAWQNSQAPVAQSAGSTSTSNELEKQVSPGRSRSAGSASTTKGKTYTPQDITKFFNDVRSGKYKGRESERDRIERDIFAAQRENRIQINA